MNPLIWFRVIRGTLDWAKWKAAETKCVCHSYWNGNMQSPEEESQESHLHWLETEWRNVKFSNKFNIFMISLNQNHADKENTKDTNMVKRLRYSLNSYGWKTFSFCSLGRKEQSDFSLCIWLILHPTALLTLIQYGLTASSTQAEVWN